MQDPDRPPQSATRYLAAGAFLLLLGALFGSLGIALPVHEASLRAQRISVSRAAVAAAVALPIIGVMMMVLRQRAFDWIPTEPDEHITAKHVAYLVVVVGAGTVAYVALAGHLTGLGYVEVR
jgi:hypothetical protein